LKLAVKGCYWLPSALLAAAAALACMPSWPMGEHWILWQWQQMQLLACLVHALQAQG
jgi:hypothetical protein